MWVLLAAEALADGVPYEGRLMRYSQKRYARSAFVYAFARQWMDDEQSAHTRAGPRRSEGGSGTERFGTDATGFSIRGFFEASGFMAICRQFGAPLPASP